MMSSHSFPSLWNSVRSLKRRSLRKRLRTGALPLESLESRIVPTNIAFQIPQSVADAGVQVGVYYNSSSSAQFLSASGQYVTPTNQKTVPLIQLTSPSVSYTGTQWETISLPDSSVNGGEVFVFVGPVTTGLPIKYSATTSVPNIPTPKALGNPQDLFTQFEYTVLPAGSPANGSPPVYDTDISFVDSVGVPLTATSPSDTSITSIDLDQVGIAVDQQSVYAQYQAAFPSGNPFSQSFETSLAGTGELVAPQDILSAETTTLPSLADPTLISDGSLPVGQTYNYLITAYSNNVIPRTNLNGQSLPSNVESIATTASTPGVLLSWAPYVDPNVAGYDIYRSVGTSGTFSLIAQVSSKVTSFEDLGADAGSQTIEPATASDYGFNPLSTYFTASLESFFNYYRTHQFDIVRDGAEWVGNTVAYQPAGSAYTYTVLQLTAISGTDQGGVVRIYEPLFSPNTIGVASDLPPMPSWMGSGAETASEMVFACDGAFASSEDPDALNEGLTGPEGDIENSIVSAFNRGIATDFSVAPANWALSAPAGFSAYPTVGTNGGNVSAGTYYYTITAIDGFGESTPISTPVQAVVTGESEPVTLNFSSENVGYSINNVAVNGDTVTVTVSVPDNDPFPSEPTSLSVSGFTGLPINGTFTLTSAIKLGNVTASTFTLTYPSAPAPSGNYTGGGMVSTVSIVGANAAISYNIYRGPSLQNMQLIANVPNTGQTSYIDGQPSGNSTSSGAGTVGTPLPQLFYPTVDPSITLAAGSTSGGSTLSIVVGPTTSLTTGMTVTGPGIAPNTTITVTGSGTTLTLTLSSPAGAGAGKGNFTFATPAAGYAGTSKSDSAVLTLNDISSTTLISAGMNVAGPGIPAYTTVVSIFDSTQVLLSAPAGAGAGSGNFAFTTASNQYSSFIHGVSINGLAYGYPYDDQGSYSSNIGYKSDPGTVTINLFPLTASALAIDTTDGATTSLPVAAVNTPYAEMIEATGGGGGYTFSVAQGKLPTGLSLDPATGFLSGTPTIAGTSSFTIRVADGNGDTAVTQNYTLVVNGANLVVTTPSVPATYAGATTLATINAGVSFVATTPNNSDTLTLSSADFATLHILLQPGMTVTVPGTEVSATIKSVSDTTPTVILESEMTGISTFSTPTDPSGTYSFTFVASGTGMTYSLAGNPSWLSISSSGQLTASTGAVAGNYTFNVTVGNTGTSDTVTQSYNLQVYPPLTINTSSVTDGNSAMGYSQTITTAGGSGGNTFTISGSLPPGLTIDPTTGALTGTITSTATQFSGDITDGSTSVTNVTGSNPGESMDANGNLISGEYIQSGTTISSGAGSSPITLSQAASGTANPQPGPLFTAASYTFTVQVTDSAGETASHQYTLVVSPIGITTTSLPTFLVGDTYNMTINIAAGIAITNASISNDPTWITPTLSDGNVTLAIAPTTEDAGLYTFTLTVTDAESLTNGTETASYTYSIDVYKPFTLPTGPLSPVSVNARYTSSVAASGGTGSFTYQAIGLPNWLTLNPTTGLLAGTPSTAQAGNVAFEVSAIDSNSGAVVTQYYSLVVTDPSNPHPALSIVTTSLPDVDVNASFIQQIVTGGGSGGFTKMSFTVTSGILPLWIDQTLFAATGILSGTPTTSDPVPKFTVQAADAYGDTASQSFNFTVYPALSIGSTPATAIALPTATVGTAYNDPILVPSTTSGSSPYTIATNNLPPWLKLVATGTGFTLEGIPGAGDLDTPVKPVPFTVEVTDATGATAYQLYTLPVAASASPLVLTTTLPDADLNTPYYQSVVISPLSGIAITDITGQPTGLTNPDKTVAIAGIPTERQNVPYTINVTTNNDSIGTVPVSLTVNSAPAINTTTLTGATVGSLYSKSIQSSGGTGPFTFSLSAGTSLPADGWLTLNPTTGLLSGMPGAADAGTTVSFVITATDAAGGMSSQSYSFSVNGSAGTGPVVNLNTAEVSDNATTLTITGSGFTPASGTGQPSVTLTSNGGDVPAGYSSTFEDDSHLLITFASNTTLPIGALYAVVTVNGQSSGTPAGSPTEVADVETPTPTKNAPTIAPTIPIPSIPDNDTSLTIMGNYFDASDQVTLTSSNGQPTGSAKTTFVSSVELKVTLNPGVDRLADGSLFATVRGDNGTSNTAKIADVVSGSVISPTMSTIALGTPTFNQVDGVMTELITLQAKDANGNNITTGGATVVFSLAAGSVGGLFTLNQPTSISPSVTATDNQNGTYTAYFTSAGTTDFGTLGTATITATINRMQVTAAPTSTATFDAEFATGMNFSGAPWTSSEGGFTATGESVTTSSSSTNIVTYDGSVPPGTGTSESIGINVSALRASGTGQAALVSRYTNIFAYYYAGLRATPTGYKWVIARAGMRKTKILASVPAHLKGKKVIDITFQSDGPHLQLFVSGQKKPVLSTKDRSYTRGSVGILGSANVTFVGPFTASPIGS